MKEKQKVNQIAKGSFVLPSEVRVEPQGGAASQLISDLSSAGLAFFLFHPRSLPAVPIMIPRFSQCFLSEVIVTCIDDDV